MRISQHRPFVGNPLHNAVRSTENVPSCAKRSAKEQVHGGPLSGTRLDRSQRDRPSRNAGVRVPEKQRPQDGLRSLTNGGTQCVHLVFVTSRKGIAPDSM